MKMAPSETCCCGCSVKITTLMILWIDAIIYLYFLIEMFLEINNYGIAAHTVLTVYFMVEVIILFLAIFGIHHRRPWFLIPHFVSQLVEVTLFVGLTVMFLFWSSASVVWLNKFLNVYSTIFPCLNTFALFILQSIEGGVIIVFFVFAVLQWYLSYLVFTCYQSLSTMKAKNIVMFAAPGPVLQSFTYTHYVPYPAMYPTQPVRHVVI